jgi:large subunit ribosomal protein L15
MNITEVNTGIVSNKKRKRIGRGVGSGIGKTSGRGHNGHKSRSGYSRHPSFQGGQLPMIRRTPKRGFTNSFAATVFGINVGVLNEAFTAGAEIDANVLKTLGLVKAVCDEVKILGDGEVTKPLKLTVTRISATARQKVEAAGGTVTIVPPKRTPKERVAALNADKS